MRYIPGPNRLLTADKNGKLRIRDAGTIKCLRILSFPDGIPASLDITPDQSRIAAGYNGNVYVWDLSGTVRRMAWILN